MGVEVVGKPRQEVRKTDRVRAWLGFMEGEAGLNGAEAARLAGYRWPEKVASELRRKWRREVEEIEERVREQKRLSDEELESIPTVIARNVSENSQNRLKALELIARIRGKLNDKLNVTVSRAELMKQLDDAMGVLVQVSRINQPQLVEDTIRPLTGTQDPANSNRDSQD